MPWGSAVSTSLIIVTVVAYMPVLVALEALCDYIVPIKWFTIVEFVVPD